MPTYTAWVHAHCAVKVTLETDEPITDPEELKQKMVDEGEPNTGLCWHCSEHIDITDDGVDWDNTDFEVTEDE